MLLDITDVTLPSSLLSTISAAVIDPQFDDWLTVSQNKSEPRSMLKYEVRRVPVFFLAHSEMPTDKPQNLKLQQVDRYGLLTILNLSNLDRSLFWVVCPEPGSIVRHSLHGVAVSLTPRPDIDEIQPLTVTDGFAINGDSRNNSTVMSLDNLIFYAT